MPIGSPLSSLVALPLFLPGSAWFCQYCRTTQTSASATQDLAGSDAAATQSAQNCNCQLQNFMTCHTICGTCDTASKLIESNAHLHACQIRSCALLLRPAVTVTPSTTKRQIRSWSCSMSALRRSPRLQHLPLRAVGHDGIPTRRASCFGCPSAAVRPSHEEERVGQSRDKWQRSTIHPRAPAHPLRHRREGDTRHQATPRHRQDACQRPPQQ